MGPSVAAALAWARSQRSRFIADLQRFASFPSVSSDPRCAGAMHAAAAWLARALAHSGLEHARVITTSGPPVVYADWLRAGARPTILIYGHYDVQPTDPLSEWHSPPFAPTVRGDRVYARGITDDKGQLMAHIFSLCAYLRAARALPVNVRIVVEGEEEIGSPSFGQFIEAHRQHLACDGAVVSDTPMLGPDRPAITYALRGGLSLEVSLLSQSRDLHSGLFGGALHNPLQALCELVASFHYADGRIAIAGFYDQVRAWSARERAFMARSGPADGEILRAAGARTGWGEPGYTAYERTTIRPSLSVTGITGGYQGPGNKAVIPARATVRLNARLVPDQAPATVYRRLLAHLARCTPSTVRSVTSTPVLVAPVVLDRSHALSRAASEAYRRGFGARPTFVRNGGTIAAVSEIHHRLRVPVVLMGFALPDARLHAPNENLHLPTFFRSIDTCTWFLSEAAAIGRTARGVAA